MSEWAIRVVGLGKRFQIGSQRQGYRTLRETLTDSIKAPLRRTVQLLRGQAYGASELNEELWALRDLNFEVNHGEVIGVIGRNGAGKSTLLKVLSRITEPSEGYAEIRGRVASLLEVGTGFHPELTGRENIYLNGAILGMGHREIDRKFDEMVDFAEVARFIDTPVKHYSSGMRLRLGFSVAAHLDPEILVIDEVLAVGDAAFQRKCLGKMDEASRMGRTILFVSHNMSAVANLCSKSIWLDEGRIRLIGPTDEVIQAYLGNQTLNGDISLIGHPGRRRDHTLLKRLRLLWGEEVRDTFLCQGPFTFEVQCDTDPELIKTMTVGFSIRDVMGGSIFAGHMNQYRDLRITEKGKLLVRATIQSLPLVPGIYHLSVTLGNGSYDLDAVDNALAFEVVWNKNIPVAYPPHPRWGVVFTPVDWQYEPFVDTETPDEGVPATREQTPRS